MIRTAQKIKMLSPKDIKPNPYQLRRRFCQKEMQLLANSLKEVGMISPLIVRRNTTGYELICGQRRLRAAIMAGFTEVPVIIVKAGDAQCAQLSIIENIHRKNLGIFEEAEGFYNLMVFHRIKKEKLQKSLSVNPFVLNDKVRLLSLKEPVRQEIENTELPEVSIKELLRLHNEEKQLEIIKKACEEHLPTAEIRKLVSANLISIPRKKEKDLIPRIIEEKNFQRESLYINTVKRTVEILKRYGAQVEYIQNDNGECTEFIIKTFK